MKYIPQYPKASDELIRLGYRLKTLEHIKARIEELEHAKYSIGSSTSSSSPIPGGGSRNEDKIGTMIAKSDMASAEYADLYRQCIPQLAAMDALSGQERRVLEIRYYNHAGAWDVIAARELCLSIPAIYKLKNRALKIYAEIRGYPK